MIHSEILACFKGTPVHTKTCIWWSNGALPFLGIHLRFTSLLYETIKETCSNFNQSAFNIAFRTSQITKDVLLTLLADAGTCTTSSLCDNRDSTYRNRKTQVNEHHK